MIHPRLRLVFWELTRGCNLRCVHCRAAAELQRSPDELVLEECRTVVDSIASAGSPILVLTGGEPLYRPDVFDIAAHAASRGLRVAVASNGTLMTDDAAARLKASGVVRVSISLDGVTADTHDGFRGQSGAFEAARRGMEAGRRAGLSLQVNTTVVNRNVDQLPAIYDAVAGWGADAWHLFMLVPVGCGLEVAPSEQLGADTYERILHWIYTRAREGRMEMRATCAPHYYRVIAQRAPLDGLPVTDVPPHRPHGPAGPGGLASMTRGCLAGTGVCFISYRGEVQPCGYLPISAGNVRRTPFKAIWEEGDLWRSFRDPRALEGKCGACEYKVLCGGCRARAYGMTGNYLGEEPFCVYEPPNWQRPCPIRPAEVAS